MIDNDNDNDNDKDNTVIYDDNNDVHYIGL